MLPTEPPLSLHRLVAPIPPARTPETAAATHQTPAPAPAAPQSATPLDRLLAVGQNQVGNAAVAAQANAVPHPPVVVAVVAPKPKPAQPS
ncbi:hypothetical protein [Streptomyces sp. NPDC059850]|uniref:hypothetical protein n=1 Tax=Streptomyces sp. NPDC059850 TaxID=3346970 RepID=UPI0036598EC9